MERRALVGEDRRGPVDAHAGQAMQPHHLDYRAHVRLRVLEAQRAAANTQPPRQGGQIEHQRRIAEGQITQIDGDVASRLDGPGEGLPSVALRGSILVAPAREDCRSVIELDDPGKL